MVLTGGTAHLVLPSTAAAALAVRDQRAGLVAAEAAFSSLLGGGEVPPGELEGLQAQLAPLLDPVHEAQHSGLGAAGGGVRALQSVRVPHMHVRGPLQRHDCRVLCSPCPLLQERQS